MPPTALPITFTCKACGRAIRVSADRAGRRGPCPGCGAPLTVPAPNATGPATQPAGVWDSTKIGHIRLRVPLYADHLRRRQRRTEQYLTPEEAHTYVLRLYHEHVLQVVTLVLIGLLLLTVLSLLQDGFIGAAITLGKQLLWSGPLSGGLYAAGRFLCVPPAPRAPKASVPAGGDGQGLAS